MVKCLCSVALLAVGLGAPAAAADSANVSLVPYEIVGDGIAEALTDRRGDARNGRAVFVDRDRGHCLLCHAVASIDEPFQGTIGPDLSAVGDRLSSAQLRLRLVDPTRLNADTIMPAYYRVHDLNRVGEAYVGKPVLDAQEIEGRGGVFGNVAGK